MPAANYQYAKRQREIEKQKKRAAKQKRKELKKIAKNKSPAA